MKDPMVVLGVVVVALLLGLVGGTKLLPWLARRKQGYPYEEQVERWLLPLLYQAICAAYKVSERAVDEFGVRMQGADKQAIAVALYPKLPMFVRQLVGEPDWCVLVQQAFDEFLEFYGETAEGLDRAFAVWAQEWEALPLSEYGAEGNPF